MYDNFVFWLFYDIKAMQMTKFKILKNKDKTFVPHGASTTNMKVPNSEFTLLNTKYNIANTKSTIPNSKYTD